MAEAGFRYGLQEVRPGAAEQSVVLLHGIRQTRQDMLPFAQMVSAHLAGPQILVYGYDHTRGLAHNGRALSDALKRELPEGRIDLVGYSMGGLVARLAASEEDPSRIHTVVTLATPNRGSLSNAELTALGQIGRQAFESLLSPIIPRSEGVKDLTRAREIMRLRRKRLMNGDRAFTLDGDKRRYVSIPALWYSEDKAVFQPGPSLTMSGLVAGFKLAALKVKLEAMKKSHDGIVTEASNNLTLADGNDWAEFHLARPGPSKAPPLCHAVVEDCDQHDHMSILEEDAVAELVGALIDTADWRDLKTAHPRLINARLHPFDV